MNSQRQVSTFAIALLIAGLMIGVWLSTPTCYATDPEDLPWSNETDVFIVPTPPLPPIFSDFNITPTEIELGEDVTIGFVIENINNRSITWLSTTRIGDITQIITIELDNYESKIISYRIIPHAAGEYDVWIDGMTGTFNVISIIPEPDPLEELSVEIDKIDVELVNLRQRIRSTELTQQILVDAMTEGWDTDNELESRVDALETHSTEISEQIESLEYRISKNQTNILYAYLAIAVLVIVPVFYVISRTDGREDEQE